jgi:hypothetical protein
MSNKIVRTDVTQPIQATTGLGAWYKHDGHYYYQQGDGSLGTNPDDIHQFVYDAIMGLKLALNYVGFGSGMNLTNGGFGKGMTKQVKAFQAAAFGGQTSQMDGVVGPHTARALLEKIAFDVEAGQHIPNHYLVKLIGQESGFDPGAQGFTTPLDRGANQISLFYHPDVTNAQAMNPVFSIPYGGRLLASAYAAIKDWDGALASYNIGQVRATDWVKHGKPASGLLAGTFDYAAQATKYVAQVKDQPV